MKSKRFLSTEFLLSVFVVLLSAAAILYYYTQGYIIAYGDAESHLNIAKRVVDGLTPGFAQLGGIWLPLPHILLIPFVKFDVLWQTGLAGSIVSGIAFVISALFLYKLVQLLTRNTLASIVTVLVFVLNPNILYMQTTPMTEIPLIMFFVLSSYFFIRFIKQQQNLLFLLLAAFFGFLATLSRYDGWFLVLIEAGILIALYFPFRIKGRALARFRIKEVVARRRNDVSKLWTEMQGKVLIFSTLGFFGIFLWLLWDFLILGDPFYFTSSEFSAKAQQEAWLARGELPAKDNLFLSTAYYSMTSFANIGFIAAVVALFGFAAFLLSRTVRYRFFIGFVLLTPFIFYVITLFLGQSVIFIPSLTPETFEWQLFNVRYGVMMVPFAAIFIGYLFFKSSLAGRVIISALLVMQLGLFGTGYAEVVTLEDGTRGLSSFIAKEPAAQAWIEESYDHGLILADDYSKSVSLLRAGIPMENFIYIGTKPYWEESLEKPEKYARWVVAQEGDKVWKELIENPAKEARLYSHFNKVYTSSNLLVFRKMESEQDYGAAP